MSLAALKPSAALTALARAVRAPAWPPHRSPAAPNAADDLPATTMPRRTLPRDELAAIDALRLLIGPAFAAAMARTALQDADERAWR